MNAFIILLIVLLAIGLVIGFSWVETVVIVWIGSLLGLAVPFNTCFFYRTSLEFLLWRRYDKFV